MINVPSIVDSCPFDEKSLPQLFWQLLLEVSPFRDLVRCTAEEWSYQSHVLSQSTFMTDGYGPVWRFHLGPTWDNSEGLSCFHACWILEASVPVQILPLSILSSCSFSPQVLIPKTLLQSTLLSKFYLIASCLRNPTCDTQLHRIVARIKKHNMYSMQHYGWTIAPLTTPQRKSFWGPFSPLYSVPSTWNMAPMTNSNKKKKRFIRPT